MSKPLAICGLRRSGTTITWNLLRQHPALYGLDEPFGPYVTKWISQDPSQVPGHGQPYLDEPIRTIALEHHSWMQPKYEVKHRFRPFEARYLERLLEVDSRLLIDTTRGVVKISHLQELGFRTVLLIRDPRAWATSHLRRSHPGFIQRPTHFFNTTERANYWSMDSVYEQLFEDSYQRHTVERLVRLWGHLNYRATMQGPHEIITLEELCTKPRRTLQKAIGPGFLQKWPFKFNLTTLRGLSPPAFPDDPRWDAALDTIPPQLRQYVYEFPAVEQ